MSNAALEVNNLAVTFLNGSRQVHAVRGLDFSINSGEVLAVVGESGCGKTAMCLALMRLLPRSTVATGVVRVEGENIMKRTDRELNVLRGSHISMVFQDSVGSLNPVMKIGSQVAESIRSHRNISSANAKTEALELLRTVGIADPVARASQYPHECSGGMRQRVGIAIAIANSPSVLILDEPTTALDVTVQAQVLEAISEIRSRTNIAILLVTHDLGVVAGIADRVIVMYGGRIIEESQTDSIFYSPKMPYTIGLLGALAKEHPAIIAGSPSDATSIEQGCRFANRCPLAVDVCYRAEPELVGAEHRFACHRGDEIGSTIDPRNIFSGVTT